MTSTAEPMTPVRQPPPAHGTFRSFAAAHMKARLLLWPALVLATAGGLGVVLLQPSRPADVEALAREAVLKRLPSGAVANFQDIRIHDYGVMGERGVCGQVEAPAGSGQRMEFAVRILLPMAANSQGRAEAQATLDDSRTAPRAVAETRRRYCHDAAPIASAAPPQIPLSRAPTRHTRCRGRGRRVGLPATGYRSRWQGTIPASCSAC